jgi:hypothetical protein
VEPKGWLGLCEGCLHYPSVSCSPSPLGPRFPQNPGPP